jgi:hypothetical protein
VSIYAYAVAKSVNLASVSAEDWLAITKERLKMSKMSRATISIDGVERTVKEWSEISGVNANTIHSRLRKGITGAELIAPVKCEHVVLAINGETHTLSEWSRIVEVSYNVIQRRYYRGVRGEDLIAPVRITKKEMHEIWRNGNFVWKGD